MAHPLAEVLGESVEVWYDDFALKVGDSLRRSIDNGLANCRYGVVILSPAFFSKEWPQRELDGLAAREVGGKKVILPVWHRIDFDGVRAASPTLADRVAAKTSEGMSDVAAKLLDVITEREDNIAGTLRTSRDGMNHPAGTPAGHTEVAAEIEKMTTKHNLTWTVRANGRTIGDPRPLEATYKEGAECAIEEITSYYVRLRNVSSGRRYTVPLGDVELSFDEVNHRPLINIRKKWPEP